VQMHPYVASQVARERQRDMWAEAQRHSQARQFIAQAREARRARRARRRMRQAVRRAVRVER
jgi:hypothetical protein